jgi:hypothetical protein
MAIDRLLRANRTVLMVPIVDINGVPTLVGADNSLAPFTAPTAALLETWRTISSLGTVAAAHGGNPSGAILDDMDLGLAASDTDTQLVLTSVGNEVTPTFKNVDATLTALRDKNKADTGVYNFATGLFVGPDVRFAIVDRIGVTAGTAFAVGQAVSLFEVSTDYPIDQKADRGNLAIQQQPAANGNVNPNYSLAA